ncbi:IS701 family transposase [Streptantibioticus ferralitis]|uniref:Transposase n=1 Tax=Streptantibioticus ferralitis TaxID=236510 RepID=A0ABT5ZAB1_9ACTN|nr:transposase [Streptantibioticus ferralitis]MDF2260709.1 transposase [Streptantibioticus ferralitis]
MSGIASFPSTPRRQTHEPSYARAYDALLSELCAELFTSLPRSDQRRKGMDYVRGLLEAKGRKSIRNIAALSGGQATEQSLHHFVCSSTWDWAPVRRALAHYLVRDTPPHAWVVRPMVTPKAGEHSVGVDRRYSSALGQVLNAQQAVGVWAATEDMSSPVNWRLHLSKAWIDDSDRRSRASIPEGLDAESLGDCAVQAYLEMAHGWGLPVRPVVMDAREADAMSTVGRLRAAGAPLLVRINPSQPLTPADPTLAGRTAEPMAAHQIMMSIKDMRRPVMWSDHGPGSGMRTSLAAAIRVRVPSRPTRITGPQRVSRNGELVLLGEWDTGRSMPAELWLTDLTAVHPAALLRLSKLTRRVDRDFMQIADQVGIRDYAGRSFSGWHRHATLASGAHAVAALAGAAEREMSYVS